MRVSGGVGCAICLVASSMAAPSMAADVEIGGQFRVMANSSNFGWHAATISDDQPADSFFNQRFRTWFDVNTLDGPAGYLEIEAGHNTWGGQGDEFPKGTAFEIRRAYLRHASDETGEFRVGIIPWSDSFGDVLASGDHDFNFGGLSFVKPLGTEGELRLAALHLREEGAGVPGDSNLYAVDADIGNGLGFSVYALADQGGYSYDLTPAMSFGTYDSATDIWVGARGKHGEERVLDWFVIYNTGEVDEAGARKWEHSGLAAKVAASLPVGGEKKLRVQMLYSTGDDGGDPAKSGEFRTIAQGWPRDNFGAMGYWSTLGLTSPHGPSDVNDLGVSLQNRSLGLVTLQAGLDVPMGESRGAYFAFGWLQSAEDNPTSSARDMGVEILAEYRHKLGEGMGLEAGVAYLFTGDFYKALPADPEPDNLFEVFARVQLEF